MVKKKEKIDIKKELEEKIKVVDDYANHLKRLQADFENYIKRTEKEKQNLINNATYRLVLKLLTIMDDFESALNVIKNDKNKELVKGVEMIFSKLNCILKDEGVVCINCEGKFDPYKHEVIDFGDGEDGMILEELQRGYMLNDNVIRPSKVKVARAEDRLEDK